MELKINTNVNFSKLSENYLFSDIAKKVKAHAAAHPEDKIIRLGIGDVTLPLTSSVTDAMGKAVLEMGNKETFRGYAPEYGYDFLREAISRHYKRFGVSVPPENIYASDGAKCDCGNLVDIFGDNEILIPDPVYPVYLDSNVMAGRKATLLPTGEQTGFLPRTDGLAEKPYVVYLCSPGNPTGAAFDREGLAEWVRFAAQTGSLIIYDSAYEAFVSEDLPRSVYEIDGAEEVAVEICSLSKSAGFTGTRCGWCVIPGAIRAGGVPLCKLWERRQATKFNGVPYVVQRGAEAALSETGRRESMDNIAYYMKNARVICSMLKERGIFFTGGVNSPYVWMKCPGGTSSWEFFDLLLSRAAVVGTPGSGFGKCGEGYFRLTAFGSADATKEAVARIADIL